MHAIDFQNARLSWVTLDGIHGDWAIVAAAEKSAAAGAAAERFVLAPAVMAGDVFGTGRLPLDPAYTYQFFASTDQHVMVRESAVAGVVRADSEASNGNTFSRLDIHAPSRAVATYDIASLTPPQLQRGWPLSMKIDGNAVDNAEHWSVQCPVNHINSRGGDRTGVQIETGPVLLPKAWFPATEALQPGGFLLAYIFCSRADELDLLTLAPTASGARTYSRFERLTDVSIELYGKVS